MTRNVFITGGTGYLGRHLIPPLLNRGHYVRALVRPGSERKISADCRVALGDALKQESFAHQIKPADAFVQLVGVPHPSPAKAKLFREIDLVSVRASVAAAVDAGIQHFIYVSVAQPAPMMKTYQAVRAEGEALIRGSGLNTTILRPWYVLGPGHRWPYAFIPFYWLCERLPATRVTAKRLGLITLAQMTGALVTAVENPAQGVRIVEVPEIRAAAWN
ncbi:MAG: NAD(P)H-binding protein [Verrucomicrobia bacterium]|nr:NAD(P)H-binding protein [Verrucomicrobiota bacterium]